MIEIRERSQLRIDGAQLLKGYANGADAVE
jgi:hypothetical protein